MTIAKKIEENLKRASYIRAMFEEGERRRKIYGVDKVMIYHRQSITEPPRHSGKN